MSKKSKALIAIIAILILLLAIVLIIILTSGQAVEPPGDLLGAWAITGNFIQPDAQETLLLQINQLLPAAEGENTYQGVGCMQTESSAGWAPLTLQAVYDPEAGQYTLNMLSTLVAPELDAGAAIIRFIGEAEMASGGIKNDTAGGLSYSTLGEIPWAGEHTGLGMVECPAWDAALSLLGEFGLHRDLAYIPALDVTNFHGETNIVSLQMRAEASDGTYYLADYHTDIFSPDVNFIDLFRFDTHRVGTTPTGQAYHFTLLDMLGEPLPGATDEDTFRRCDQGAATNLRAVVHLRPDTEQVDYVEVIWDAPEIIPGYFDPENGNGFYQLVLEYTPGRETGMLYGSESIQPMHHIPWNSFEPGAAAFPTGNDYGISLSELEEGQYIISMGVYSYYDPPAGESGFDCRVSDSRYGLFLTKQGNQITVQPAGAISGFVSDEAGNPLANIAVKVDGLNTGFHEGVCSGENGYYLFTRLPLDSYLLSAGGIEAEDCPANSYATVTQPDLVLEASAPIVEGVNFVLGP